MQCMGLRSGRIIRSRLRRYVILEKQHLADWAMYGDQYKKSLRYAFIEIDLSFQALWLCLLGFNIDRTNRKIKAPKKIRSH